MSYHNLPWYAVPHLVSGWRKRLLAGSLPCTSAGFGLGLGYVLERFPSRTEFDSQPTSQLLLLVAAGFVALGVLSFVLGWFTSPSKIDDADEIPEPVEWNLPTLRWTIDLLLPFVGAMVGSSIASPDSTHRWVPIVFAAGVSAFSLFAINGSARHEQGRRS